MSGAAGGVTINKEDLKATIRDYRETVLKPLNLDTSYNITGVRRRPEKMVFGDIDIVLSFPQGEKKQLKKDFANHLAQIEKIPTMPHKKNLKYFIHGSIVTTLYPIVGKEDQFIQIDNIIAASEDEGKFTYSMLDLPAQEQGLALGLAKTIFTELDPNQVKQLFKNLNIPEPIETPNEGEEYDFNLNTSELSLRIVPIGKNGGREIWKSSNPSNIKILLKSLDIDIEKDKFETILQKIKGFKNRRSIERLKGMFARNIRVGSAEVGRDKGIAKQQSLDKVAMLEEKYGLLAISLIKPFITEGEDSQSIALIPGAFKPPHKDHLSRINAAAKLVDKAIIIISPLDRIKQNQIPISAKQSLNIWNLYKNKGVLNSNVEFIISPHNSPVKVSWDIVRDNPNNEYLVVYGKGENKRWMGIEDKFPNVKTSDLGLDLNLSSSGLRAALLNNDDISKWLPNGISSKEYQQALNTSSNINEASNNKFTSKSLISNLLEQENNIKAFFGGSFKPPTKGHFLAVKKILENYPEIDTLHIVVGGGLRDNISQDESNSIWEMYKKYLPLDKVEIINSKTSPFKYVKDYIKTNTDHKSYILLGSKADDDQDMDTFLQQKNLFDQYGDHVEVKNIVIKDKISGAKAREASKSSKEQFFQFLPEELTNEEKQTIFNYIQTSIQEGEVKEIKLNNLLTDKIKLKLEFFLKALKKENSKTKQAFSKIIHSSRGEIELSDEDKKEIGDQMKNALKLAGLTAITLVPGGVIAAILIKIFKAEKYITPTSFQKDKIEEKELIKEEGDANTFDYSKHISSLSEFMLDSNLNINPLPEVEFINDDVENANDFFGKTAYYIPQQNKIVLYTLNRHPKDVMRSFAHEMIHHMQNCEDRLGEITTQNTNEDDHLENIEREAYEKGNICFRNWTDTLTESILTESILGDKIICDNCGWSWNIVDGGDDLFICHKCGHDNSPLNEAKPYKHKHGFDDKLGKDPFGISQFAREIAEEVISEGRYDALANKLSSIAFEAFKDIHDRGDKEGSFEFRVDHPDEEHDIPSKDFYFDFEGVVEITDDEYGVDGGANAGFDKDGNEITPLLSVKLKIPKNPDWQEISFDLKDVVRHELEHLTQDGDNLKGGVVSDDPKLKRPSKYMKDDQLIRDLIDADLLSKSQYFKLKKEVDAMLQGLYFKAKKSKRPFSNVIDDYLNIFLDQDTITQEEKEEILKIWRTRASSLSLPKF